MWICSWLFSGGTSVLWWLYIDYRMTMNETMIKDLRETEEPNGGMKTPKDHAQGLLIYAVSATVFTVSPQRDGKWNMKEIRLVFLLFHAANFHISAPAGNFVASDVVYEEEGGSDHRPVPRGGKSVYPPAAVGTAALLHVSRSFSVLDLLDHGPPLPRHHWWDEDSCGFKKKNFFHQIHPIIFFQIVFVPELLIKVCFQCMEKNSIHLV